MTRSSGQRLDSSERVASGPRPVSEEAPVELSVIVVMEQKDESLAAILNEYAPALRSLDSRFEFLVVCGPQRIDLEHQLATLSSHVKVRFLHVNQPVSQSTLLKLAAENSSAEHLITLPSSFRVEPDALPELVRRLREGDVDVVVARRWPRDDGLINRVQSRICNGLINLFTGAGLHDITCRVYALRREVLAETPLYGNYFRFLPVIARREGFDVEEVRVGQHTGGGRTRVYSPRVYLGWLLDIFGVSFLLRFTQSPLRFFGLVGGWTGFVGGAILLVLLVQRLQGQGIADRPLLLLGALLVTLGVQFIALGLIGEIVVHYQAPEMSTYRLAREHRRDAARPGDARSLDDS